MIKELKNLCDKFLQSLTEVPRNKRELQFLLTSYLKQYYDRVFVDYEVPLNLLAKNDVDIPEKHSDEWTTPESYPWHENACPDIVVEKDSHYAVISLSYIVESAYRCPKVFGNEIDNTENNISTSSVMYDFWKNVHKIEAITDISGVVCGLVILLTNEEKLWVPQKSSNEIGNIFSICEGATVEPGILGNNENLDDRQPDFTIDDKYKCHWKDTNILEGDQYTSPYWFRYIAMPVKQYFDRLLAK